jgi:amino acid transporter
MTQRLLLMVLAFAVPFATYWIYRRLAKREEAAGRAPWPVTILFVAGALLAAQAFALTALTERSIPPNYEPAR